MKCQHCRAENPADARVCSNCENYPTPPTNHPTPAEPTPTMAESVAWLESLCVGYDEPDAAHLRNALAAMRAVGGEPRAFATEDGDRVVTAKTMNGARKDGGAILSSMCPYSVPLYAFPSRGQQAGGA